MSKIVTTENSTYEIDRFDGVLKVRRLGGNNEITPNTGVDGMWKRVLAIGLVANRPMTIVWAITKADGQIVGRSTITSNVIKIEEQT